MLICQDSALLLASHIMPAQILVCLLLSSCTPYGNPTSVAGTHETSPLQHSTATQGEPSAARRISQTSAALHGFIAGSIYTDRGEYSKATESLSKANALLEENVSPATIFQLTEAWIATGNFERIMQFIEKAHARYRDNYELTLLYSTLLNASESTSNALSSLHQIPPHSPQALEGVLLRGAILSNQGQLPNALNEVALYTKINHNDAKGYYFLSGYQELNGLLTNAESSLKEAIKLNPKSALAHIAYARLLFKAGAKQKALQEYRQIIGLRRKNPRIGSLISILKDGEIGIGRLNEVLKNGEKVRPSMVWTRFRLADLYFEDGLISRALQQLYLSLLENPTFHEARYRIALVLSNSGSYRHAIREIERIPSSSNMYVKAQILASVLATQLNDNNVAEEHMRLALQKEKDHLQILLHLISILSNSGRLGAAELVIAKALETSPKSTSLIYEYAMLIHALKREPEAKNLMERLLEFDRDNHAALNYLAYSNTYPPTDREKLSRALKMINTALRFYPSNGHYLDTKGWILYNLGYYDEAIQFITRATELLPDSGLVLEHLGDALLKGSYTLQAKDAYKSAIKLYENEERLGTVRDANALERAREKWMK